MYDNPKVTIDLAEYNDLLKIKSDKNAGSKPIVESENLEMHKFVICMLLNHVKNFPEVDAILRRTGIDLRINHQRASMEGRIQIGDIEILKLLVE